VSALLQWLWVEGSALNFRAVQSGVSCGQNGRRNSGLS
jgi:hypothetical protein